MVPGRASLTWPGAHRAGQAGPRRRLATDHLDADGHLLRPGARLPGPGARGRRRRRRGVPPAGDRPDHRASKPGSARMLGEAGVVPASYPTVWRRLRVYAGDSWAAEAVRRVTTADGLVAVT